jgi:hypothetical protein
MCCNNNNQIAKAKKITQNKTKQPNKKPKPRAKHRQRSTTQEKVCEDFVRNVKLQDADNVGCGIGYSKKRFYFPSFFCLLFLLQKWEPFVDLVCALSLSLCNPMFFAAIPSQL